jgi:CRISPR-associated endonuclease/helicase Cas3
MYYAHSATRREDWEPLAEHLAAVAGLAARFAEPFGAAEEARFAGLLHDLGKYSDTFTRRLEGGPSGLDHWSAGAWAALERARNDGVAAALAIHGHHVGLGVCDGAFLRGLDPAALAVRHPLGLCLTERDVGALLGRLAADGLSLPPSAPSLLDAQAPDVAAMLDVRMLFSALVDADYLATEAHFAGEAAGEKRWRPAGEALAPEAALADLLAAAAALGRESAAAPEVLALRADLLAACLAAAELTPGLFTLSAPTGGGKTLAMLAFALAHAARHGLRRVIVALPYVSILEQTAGVYRRLLAPRFGPGCVLEHHSLAGTREVGGRREPDGESAAELRRRLLAENWDAPLVVTTTVQLLESLFGHRPRACRKLHRLAGSVVLLDEAQTLPVELVVPTLAALARLAARYGSTVVFATATQPAFDQLDREVRRLAGVGWAPREIAPAGLGLFSRVRRTGTAWRVAAPLAWEELAREVGGRSRALVVVNLKRHAAELARLLATSRGDDLFHLSTNLCPAHRERVLAAVRGRLDAGAPCLLVATQCVEAGVDVDFPAVYRALAPLDSIAQAAGRCNRHDLLGRLGEVVVFRPADEGYPPGGYGRAARLTATLLAQRGEAAMDLQSPALFREYYRQLYELIGVGEEEAGRAKELRRAIGGRDFPEVARRYRLIDKDAVEVLVPYDGDAFAALSAELEREGHLTAGWVRRARPHAVSLYRPGEDDSVRAILDPVPLARGAKDRASDWFRLIDPGAYDRDLLGLQRKDDLWIA